MKKRGLSNLIATVLIVLLALAAVAIVWGFIKPVLEGAGPSVELGTKCVDVEVDSAHFVQDCIVRTVLSSVQCS